MAEEELIEDLEDEFQIIQIIHNEIVKHRAEIVEYLNDLVEEEELEREHANQILTLLQDFLMKLKEHAKEASKRGFSDFDEEEWYSWVKRTFQPYAKIGGYIDIERH